MDLKTGRLGQSLLWLLWHDITKIIFFLCPEDIHILNFPPISQGLTLQHQKPMPLLDNKKLQSNPAAYNYACPQPSKYLNYLSKSLEDHACIYESVQSDMLL